MWSKRPAALFRPTATIRAICSSNGISASIRAAGDFGGTPRITTWRLAAAICGPMRHRDAVRRRAAAEPVVLSGTAEGGGAEVIRPGGAAPPMRAGHPTRLLAAVRPGSFNHLVRAARYAGFA